MIEFTSLSEALAFVAAHGGVRRDTDEYNLPGNYNARHGAFGPASSWVELMDGAIFGVEAYSNGPLSEVTPDEDFGVKLIGFEK